MELLQVSRPLRPGHGGRDTTVLDRPLGVRPKASICSNQRSRRPPRVTLVKGDPTTFHSPETGRSTLGLTLGPVSRCCCRPGSTAPLGPRPSDTLTLPNAWRAFT